MYVRGGEYSVEIREKESNLEVSNDQGNGYINVWE
jgi:hypothetical protein